MDLVHGWEFNFDQVEEREESGNECFMDVFLGGGGGKINVSSLFSRDERLNLIEIEFY